MQKYAASDDGRTIDGRIVVFVSPSAGASEQETAQARAAVASATAASMIAAAEDGVPLCEDCEQTRRELQRKLAETA